MVSTSVEMPDWEITAHRVTLIHFDGQSWRVASKTTAGGRVRYELVHWAPADEYVIGREIEYGDAYVIARDQRRVSGRRNSRVTLLLRIVSPLIGFLSARTKAQLEARYGVDPVSTTFQSVFLEFLITLGSFVTAAIGIFAMAGTIVYKLAGSPRMSAVLFIVLGIVAGMDGSVRYGRILREERPPVGFYEWLFRRASSPHR